MRRQHSGEASPTAGRYPVDPVELDLRTRALEALLIERGLLGADTVATVVSVYEDDIGPLLGARVVARAWTDAAFKQRLLTDAPSACWELGIGGQQSQHLVAVENTEWVHNVIVCTLCSCYPWPVLGVPPTFYKSPAYRSRIVREPRKVLHDDFGLVLAHDVEVRVHDMSGETRYFVLPRRPPGTDHLDEEQLRELVTRDSMIGVAVPVAGDTRGG